MIKCPECERLREESVMALSEFLSCRDELAMTAKRNKSFVVKRRELEEAQGRVRECTRRERQHRQSAHEWIAEPPTELVEAKLAGLRECIEIADGAGVQQSIFDLSPIANGWKEVPDEVVESLLTLLRNEKMYRSQAAGYILSYFEFESHHMTKRQKSLCIGFLKAHGDLCTDAHAHQIVAELREGEYLK